MSAQTRAEPASVRRRPVTPRIRLSGLAAVALAAMAQGCTAIPPSRFNGPDPSDPRTRVPAVAYRSTVGPYEAQQPVEPAPWRNRDERAAPAAKP